MFHVHLFHLIHEQRSSDWNLRRSIGLTCQQILQGTATVHESIRYNIQYGDLNATPEQIEEAAKKARIHKTIMFFEKFRYFKVALW